MKFSAVFALLLVIMTLSGCTARNAYDGIRMQQEMECQKQPGADRDACSRRSDRSYDEYQRQLKEQDRSK